MQSVERKGIMCPVFCSKRYQELFPLHLRRPCGLEFEVDIGESRHNVYPYGKPRGRRSVFIHMSRKHLYYNCLTPSVFGKKIKEKFVSI